MTVVDLDVITRGLRLNMAFIFKHLLLTLLILVQSNASSILEQGDHQDIVHMSQVEVDAYSSSSSEKAQYNKPNAGNAVFAFAKHFQDHMVLQQAPKQATLWGFSSAIGQKVIALVKTDSHQYNYATFVESGPSPGLGKWTFMLDPIKTSSPASIFIFSDLGRLSLQDVLFGDVWLCSGQSNMEFTVSMLINGSQEIAEASNYPNIRVMTVGLNTSEVPLYDLIKIEKDWNRPSADSIGGPAWTYFSAVCWLYGKAIYKARGYPIGLIASDWGGTPVEAWSSPDALHKCNVTQEVNSGKQAESDMNARFPTIPSSTRGPKVNGPHGNSLLWNAMIHPFLGLTFYGAIWYQGEQDAFPGLAERYNCTFPAMIQDWRSKFNAASKGQTSAVFPFGFVQLGTEDYVPSESVGFPDIRWHQTADVGYVPNHKMQNVFMAVAMDLPDIHSPYASIHPRDKQDVCDRLALSGLAVAYSQKLSFQGPFPVTISAMGKSQIVIDYGDWWKLDVRSIDGFEIFCLPLTQGPKMWVPTPITATTDSTVSIDLYVCSSKPEAVRYAWRTTPCPFKACAIYDSITSLPGPPFISHAVKGSDGQLRFNLI